VLIDVGQVRAAASGFGSGEEEVPVAAGLLTQRRCGSIVDRLAGAVRPAVCGPGRPPTQSGRRPVQSSAATCRVKLCPCRGGGSRGRRRWAEAGRGVRQGGGLHPFGGIHGVGGQTSTHFAALPRHTSVSQTGTDSRCCASRRRRCGRRKLAVGGRASSRANGRPWRGQLGGRSAGAAAADCRRQRDRGLGPALDLQQAASAGRLGRLAIRHLLHGPGWARTRAWRFGLTRLRPPFAAHSPCGPELPYSDSPSQRPLLRQHIGQGKEPGLHHRVDCGPPSPSSTRRLRWRRLLCTVSCFGADRLPHRRRAAPHPPPLSWGKGGCEQQCAAGPGPASSRSKRPKKIPLVAGHQVGLLQPGGRSGSGAADAQVRDGTEPEFLRARPK